MLTPWMFAFVIGGAFVCGFLVCYAWHGQVISEWKNKNLMLYRALRQDISNLTNPR